MLEILFEKYKRYRKEKYFKNPLFQTQKNYACIGMGMHGISSIYPVLRHFNVNVKYICTKNTNWSKEAAILFPDAVFTNDISAILDDASIVAVFVCASAGAHFSILQSLFKAGKKVFIEKPPCASSAELEALIAAGNNNICKAGFQRRYWPGNKYLTKQCTKARSYIYQFYFGPYPQGNIVNELFIHAVDYGIFLFGSFTILSKTFQADKQGITIQLHVNHSNGITGMIELSSQHSWNDPLEKMSIQCAEELITVQYPLLLTGQQKPKRFFNVPSERLYSNPVITKNYFSASSLIIPAHDLNTLVLQGFYQELENFIRIVESGHESLSENDLVGLRPVYKILDELNAFTQSTASS